MVEKENVNLNFNKRVYDLYQERSMLMKEQRDIKSYFDGVLENISIILTNDFYKEKDKKVFSEIKVKIENWYKCYIEKKYA